MFESFQHKMKFLKRSHIASVAQDLSYLFGSQISEQLPKMSAALNHSLKLDLTYFFFRHYRFQHSDEFLQVLSDYLKRYYQLSLEDLRIILSLVVEMNQGRGEPSPARKELSFISYLFLCVMIQRDSSECLVDLCISPHLYKKLRTFGRALSYGTMLPDPDQSSLLVQKLTEYISYLSDKKASIPWILEIEKLRYEWPSPLPPTEGEAGKIFQLLSEIGTSGIGLKSKALRKIGESLGFEKEKGLEQCLDQICDLNLCYSVPQGKERVYFLTKEGYDLTASAFVKKWYRTKRKPLKELLTHALSYQVEVCKQLPKEQAEQALSQIAEAGPQLAPQALAALLKRLSHLRPKDELAPVAQKLFSLSEDLPRKLMLIDVLQGFGKKRHIIELLDYTSKNDPFPRVREASMLAFERLQERKE